MADLENGISNPAPVAEGQDIPCESESCSPETFKRYPFQLKRNLYLSLGVPLHQAALKGDWKAAKSIIQVYPSIVRASITSISETALHVAVASAQVDFVKELMNFMNKEDLELRNQCENTSFFYAAGTNHVDIAKILLKENDNLLRIRGNDNLTPLYMAALSGYHNMAWFVYENTNDQYLNHDDRIVLLTTFIDNNMYDLALDMIKRRPSLALLSDGNSETALHVLARKPLSFPRRSYFQPWKRYNNSSGIEVASNVRSAQSNATQLVRVLWEQIVQQDEHVTSDLIKQSPKFIFEAVKRGNAEFLAELIRLYPDILREVDDDDRTIFHVAVLHRQENVFNLIYDIGPYRNLLTMLTDSAENNMLHLAANLAPERQLSKISGEALQMQRELIWFKEVEAIMHPLDRVMKNSDDKTPYELFVETHKSLKKEGEKWLTKVARSSMLVAVLISTVGFAATFTVPGGNNNNTGIPIFIGERFFLVFLLLNAIALFSSSASILMFLSILTSTYKEEDFLVSLPLRLMIGLMTLIISIIAMALAFSSTFFIVFHHGSRNVPFVIASFAIWPIAFLAFLQLPLLRKIMQSTFGSRSLFRRGKYKLF